MKVRGAFNYDADAVSMETGVSFEGQETMTQQQFGVEVDINTIVKRFGLTGQLPENLQMPRSGDFTEVTDFHTAMNMVRRAEEEFLRVPAEIRARFEHDPGKLMAFIEDDKNYDEAVRLGLVDKPKEVARDGSDVAAGAA